MDEKTQAAVLQDAETTEELIGVLTAISVVSKRMAMKLAILDRRAAKRGGVKANARGTPQAAAHANQSNPI